MKRVIIVSTAAALVLSVAAVALAAGHRAKVNLRKTSVGKILVNGRGRTLYEFSKDTRDTNNCQKIPSCMMLWPPDITSGKPIAGKGVHGKLLGTITLPDGRQQVTYAHHPLYTYIADTGPGDTSYLGVFQAGGRWYGLSAKGHRVK